MEVALVPGTLNFSGTTTQGDSSSPQPATITNSGNAILTFNSAPALSGANFFHLFHHLREFARGKRLLHRDDCLLPAARRCSHHQLAGSPQSVTVNGTANVAALLAAAPGATMSSTASAGQTAQYQLQATPGAGYSGTLSFACSSPWEQVALPQLWLWRALDHQFPFLRDHHLVILRLAPFAS